MKKLMLMTALAAISFGSVFAHEVAPVKAGIVQDTTMKMKKKPMKMKKKKMMKDTMSKM